MELKAKPIGYKLDNKRVIVELEVDGDFSSIAQRGQNGEFITFHTGSHKSKKEAYRDMRLYYGINVGFSLLLAWMAWATWQNDMGSSFFPIIAIAGSGILILATLALFILRRRKGWKY